MCTSVDQRVYAHEGVFGGLWRCLCVSTLCVLRERAYISVCVHECMEYP